MHKIYSVYMLLAAIFKRSFSVSGLTSLMVFILVLSGVSSYAQCVSLTTLGSAATQSFNTLSNTAGSTTNNLTITGWFMTETGGGARDNEQYAVDTGGSNTGDTYSYGAAGNTDRALGSLRSGTLISSIGSCFTNNTGSTIESLTISYFGEEWRLGTAARTDQMDFQYSLNATSLTTGTWVDVNSLDFITPNTTAPASAKDGNAVENRTNLTNTISGLSIPNGATFWIRWNDADATGADDGLAVDDFSLTPNAAPSSPDYTISTTGGNIIITDVAGNAETLTMSESGGNIRFVVTPTIRTYSINGGATTAFTTPADVAIAGANSITINTEAGNDVIDIGAFTAVLPSLTINTGNNTDNVQFTGAIAYSINNNLLVTNAETVTVNGSQSLSGTGTINITANNSITVNASLTSAGNINLSTAGGQDITIQAGFNSIYSVNGVVNIQAGQDLFFGSVAGFGDTRGQTLQLNAGRDIIVDFVTYVQSDGSGGATTEAGRNITITGTSLINCNGGNASNLITTGANGDLTINAGSSINANAGSITVNADNVALAGNVGTNATVTIRPVTTGRSIDLGTNTAGSLSLNAAELNQVSTGTFIIGNMNSGDISITAAIALSAATNVELHSGEDILIDGGSFNTGGGNLLLSPGDSPSAVRPLSSGTDVFTGTLSFASDLAISIGGTTVDTEYNQLKIAGAVNLSGVDLVISVNAFTPTAGNIFIIIDNDAAEAVTSTFNGLPEGAELTNFLGSGLNAIISYTGGDGNDVSITVVSIVSIETVNANASEEGAEGTFRISRTGSTALALDVDYTLGGSVSSADYSPLLSGTLTIPAGESFTDIVITPINDNLVEGPETLTLTLEDGAAYDLSGTDLASINIADNDFAYLSVTPSTTGVSEDVGVYTRHIRLIILSSPPDGSLEDEATVQLIGSLFGSATFDDFTLLTTSVTFPAGSIHNSLQPFQVQIIDDALVEGNEFFDIAMVQAGYTGVPSIIQENQVVPGSCNGSGSQCRNRQTIAIFDNDLPDYTITTSGNAIVVTDMSGNAETLDVTENGANIRFNATGRIYTINGGVGLSFPVDVSLAGVTSITINTAGGNDIINIGGFTAALPNLTINSGIGDDAVIFYGDITFIANANLDVDLQNDDATPGEDLVALAANANLILSGTGAAAIKVSGYVQLDSGASVETVNGNLTVEANQQATPTPGSFYGILINGGVLKTSGSGTLTVKGKGGTDAVGGQKGIYVVNSGQISGGNTGAVIVEGTGGPSAGNFNDGVFVDANSIITSLGGNVSVTGLGNGTGSSETNFGVFLRNGGIITAGGSGSVTVHGTGGATAGSYNRGVVVFLTNARITSSGGNVSVTGVGGGTGSSAANWGIYMLSAGEITAGGSGTLTVQGTGGATSGNDNFGIFIENANTRITSSGGAVSVTGTGSGSAPDILIQSGAAITSSSASAGITLQSTNNGIWPNSPGTDVSTTATQKTLLGAGSQLNIDIDGLTVNTQYQQLGVVGMIDLNDALLTFTGSTYTPVLGNIFIIVNNDGTDTIIGTFNALPEGASIPNFLGSSMSAIISYIGGDGNDVSLTLVNNVVCYADTDGDGYGDPNNSATFSGTCGQGFVADNNDCNDGNPDINPAANEICDGIDNDCDNQTDEGLSFVTYYPDMDGDGFGTGSGISLCADPGMGFATLGGDCNDGNAAINPGATEVCNGIDDDCDNQTDEGLTFITYYTDSDGDGFGTGAGQSLCENPGPGFATLPGDCNDGNPDINPAANEICDGIDNDCDTQIDEGLTFITYYTDADGDGYGIGAGQSLCENPGPGFATLPGDCNDGNPDINPAANEICDGIDNDCDELIDFNDPSLVDNTPPTAICFNQTINFNGENSIPLNSNDLVSASDNCGVQSITLSPNSISNNQVNQIVPVLVTVTDINGNTATCTSQISVSGLPPGWSQSANGVGCNDGSYIEYNPSTEVWTATSSNCYYSSPFTSDQTAFAQRTLCGNGSITAEVTGISGTSLGWAGIVMRESNAPGSKKVQIMTNLSNFLRREIRSVTNGPAQPQQFQAFNRYWLRLTRTGSQIVAHSSSDGINWVQVLAVTLPMNSCIEMGLVVTNYNQNSTVTATFANVSYTGSGPLPISTIPGNEVMASVEQYQPDFSVYPNPTSGELNIELKEYIGKKVQLELYSLEGKLMQLISVDEVLQNTQTMLLYRYSSGMYFVKLRSKGLPDVTKRVVLTKG